MNPHKYSAIAHRDHDYCNPIRGGQDRAPARPAAARRHVTGPRPGLRAGRAGTPDHRALRFHRRGHRPFVDDARAPRGNAPNGPARWASCTSMMSISQTSGPTRRPSICPSCWAPAGSVAAWPASARNWSDGTRSGGYVMIGEGYWRSKAAPRLPGDAGRAVRAAIPRSSRQRAGRRRCRPHSDARDDGVDGRVGRVRMEILPRDRTLRARATGGSGHSRNAGAQPEVARRVSALGTRHAGIRRLPFLPARLADGLGWWPRPPVTPASRCGKSWD